MAVGLAGVISRAVLTALPHKLVAHTDVVGSTTITNFDVDRASADEVVMGLLRDVGIDDAELFLRLAAEEIGGAGRLVVEELSEIQALTSRIAARRNEG